MGGSATTRNPCKYGANCERKSPGHKREFTHPGDDDWIDLTPSADGGGSAVAYRAHSFMQGEIEVTWEIRNMLQVSFDNYKEKTAQRIGYLIAGNAGKVGGGLRINEHLRVSTQRNIDDPVFNAGWDISCEKKDQVKPQEEGSFINFCCATKAKLNSHDMFIDNMSGADAVWGMVNQSGTDGNTKQAINYTVTSRNPDEDPILKYGHCVHVGDFFGYSQEGIGGAQQGWDVDKIFPCNVFITAGPQARDPDNGFHYRLNPHSSMRRTYDK